jgi:charged multivesicular body protein 6
MSNEDEDEVEDELEAMQRDVEGVKMPDAPKKTVIDLPDAPLSINEEEERQQRQKERARARRVAMEA